MFLLQIDQNMIDLLKVLIRACFERPYRGISSWAIGLNSVCDFSLVYESRKGYGETARRCTKQLNLICKLTSFYDLSHIRIFS